MDLKDCNLQGGLKRALPHGKTDFPLKDFIYIHLFFRCEGVTQKYLEVVEPVKNSREVIKMCEEFILKCKALQVKE